MTFVRPEISRNGRILRYGFFSALALTVQICVAQFHSDVLRTALAFDCAITVPFFYWLLLVKSGLRGQASLALVAGISVLRGAYLLSSRSGMIIGIAAEALLVVFIATQVKRIEELFPSKTLARIARAELDVYRYAFGSSKPKALAAGARVFTIHEASGAAALFWMLALLTPGEAALMHWLLPAKLAWIFTALSIYGAIWMIAVARSFNALPIVVEAQGITLRRGMMASIYIPREAIASMSRKDDGGKHTRFAVLSDPTVWIRFNQRLQVELPMGFTREVTGVAVAPDDAQGFWNAISTVPSDPKSATI